MSSIGDYEPEDAWDVDDDAVDMARNLLRRLDLLDQQTAQTTSIDEMIAEIEQRAGQYRRTREQWGERIQLRIDQLLEDLPTLRERARHG
ncbi:MAG TPA: hypothetical protein VNN23_09645 [Ornithinibacter sp.]|nr:hypothetical protein [Ornithinibacter sp.]